MQSRLVQWNTTTVRASWSMEEAPVEQMTYRSSSSRRSGTGPGVVRVTKVVNCDCGHVVRGLPTTSS